MNVRPDEPKWPDRDRLVVSKGHASCMLYTMLAHRGYFPNAELKTFRQIDSRLQGHPCMLKTPGVEMSTGSLGHGTSVALGMALAARLLGKSYFKAVLLKTSIPIEWPALHKLIMRVPPVVPAAAP